MTLKEPAIKISNKYLGDRPGGHQPIVWLKFPPKKNCMKMKKNEPDWGCPKFYYVDLPLSRIFNNSIKQIDQEKNESILKKISLFKWKMIPLNDLTFQFHYLPSVLFQFHDVLF